MSNQNNEMLTISNLFRENHGKEWIEVGGEVIENKMVIHYRNADNKSNLVAFLKRDNKSNKEKLIVFPLETK